MIRNDSARNPHIMMGKEIQTSFENTRDDERVTQRHCSIDMVEHISILGSLSSVQSLEKNWDGTRMLKNSIIHTVNCSMEKFNLISRFKLRPQLQS